MNEKVYISSIVSHDLIKGQKKKINNKLLLLS